MLKIGVMDSGAGGRYIAKCIRNIFNVNIITYPHTKFNSFSNMTIKELKNNVDIQCNYFLSKKIDILIIGCMTLSTNLLDYIKEQIKVQVYDLYTPLPTFNKSTLIIATTNSINSNKFNKYITRDTPDLSVYIEKYYFTLIPLILNKYLFNINEQEYSSVILGCSHYSFCNKDFKLYFKNKNIIDPVSYLLNTLSQHIY